MVLFNYGYVDALASTRAAFNAFISFIITRAGLQLEPSFGFLFVGRNSSFRLDQTSDHSDTAGGTANYFYMEKTAPDALIWRDIYEAKIDTFTANKRYMEISPCLRFEVLKAVIKKISIFRHITTRSPLKINRRFV
jgi:hypothetical protein